MEGDDIYSQKPDLTRQARSRGTSASRDEIYQYKLDSIDPDGDPLRYRLLDSPVGALIDNNTGELLWFPEHVTAGDTVDFTVAVADDRGGASTQTFTVEVFSALGKIQGAVFEDLNGNGIRDTKLIQGDNPSVVFAIDVSGSTEAPFVGKAGKTDIETVLDAQVAASLALVDTLIAQGLGERINIGIIPHNSSTVIEDMNPATPEVDPYTTPLADNDNDGVPDIKQILESYYPNANNEFTSTLKKIESLVDALPGDPNVIFMSDGYGPIDPVVAGEVTASLEAKGVNFNAFGIGQYSTMETIQIIDPEAIQLTDVEEFIDLFAGWDERYAVEPLMEGVTVYLDNNGDGTPSEGEPRQITEKKTESSILGEIKPYYLFDGLQQGDYTWRQIIPSAYTQTVPSSETHSHTITAAGEIVSRWFGLYKGESDPPNSDPEFITEAPSLSLEGGETMIYRASAYDPDASTITYDLIGHPSGMTVDADEGTVVWNPTPIQVEEYYASLQAQRERLEARGRGDFVPDTVTFDVLLRARDSRVRQGLQELSVELVSPNNPPVFTSVLPENIVPQVGKLFSYTASASDGDEDELTYSLVSGPSGLTVDPETGSVSWTPTASQLGTQEFTIKVTDVNGGEASVTLEVEVVQAKENTPPEISYSIRTTAVVGQNYLSQLDIDDESSGPLSFSLVGPEGMTIDERGVISWTPTAAQLGNHTVSVTVTDSDFSGTVGATSEISFEINVSHRDVNRPPTISSVPETIALIEGDRHGHGCGWKFGISVSYDRGVG